MAVGWIEIAQAAYTAYVAYQEQEKQRADDEARGHYAQQVIDAIEGIKSHIIAELQKLRLEPLQGILNGTLTDYALYLNNPEQENLLVIGVIRTANSISEQLALILDSSAEITDFALAAWPIYVSAVSLQLSALTEWEFNHGANVSTVQMDIKQGVCGRTPAIRTELSQRNDARFTGPYFKFDIEGGEFGEEVWGYTFDGIEYTMYWNSKSDIFPHPDTVVRRKKQAEFVKYLYVPSLLKLESDLSCPSALLKFGESAELREFLEVVSSNDFDKTLEYFANSPEQRMFKS